MRAPQSRQVWAAPCQQPKINKILSAPNLLKHIHLAVPGKERREGGRGRACLHGTFPTGRAGTRHPFCPVSSAPTPRPGALGGGAPGARVGAPAGHTCPTPGLAFQAPLIPTPAADVTPDAARCGDHGNVALVGWGGQVCAREPEGQAAGSTRQGPQWGARPGLTRTRREGGRGAPRGPLRLAHRLLAQVRACPPPAAPCFPAPLRRGSTRDSSPAAPWGGVTTSAPCPLTVPWPAAAGPRFRARMGKSRPHEHPWDPRPHVSMGLVYGTGLSWERPKSPPHAPAVGTRLLRRGSPCSQTQVCLGAAGGGGWGGNGHIIHLRLEPGSTPAGAGW